MIELKADVRFLVKLKASYGIIKEDIHFMTLLLNTNKI